MGLTIPFSNLGSQGLATQCGTLTLISGHGLVCAEEDVAHGAADLADRAGVLQRLADDGQQVVAGPGGVASFLSRFSTTPRRGWP